jgi:hypothetical protein
MWRLVGLLWTHVSEERVASIFRIEEITGKRNCVRQELTVSQSVSYSLTLDPAHVISTTLKFERTRSSETSAYNKRTRHYIPEQGILQNRHRSQMQVGIYGDISKTMTFQTSAQVL